MQTYTSSALGRHLAQCCAVATLSTAVMLAIAAPVQAQDEPRAYAIAYGPLDNALAAFGATSGINVIYDAALTSGLTSQGVSGTRAADAALSQLLTGTGLTYQFAGSQSVVLQAAQADAGGAAGASGDLVLEEIVVSGERIERSVYETASSVVVVTGEQIESTPGTAEVEDILDLVPNVSQNGTSGEGASIRGVDSTGPLLGANAFLGGTRPRATITVDGRPLSYFEYINGATPVWDLERVEVFNGPQTTAQGVNSIAGATHVVTADPTFEPEFKGQAQFGKFDNRRFSVAASGPLIEDELAVRLAVDYQSRESFVRGIPPLAGFDEDQFETLTLRGKILWEPKAIPELSTKLTFNHYTSSEPQVEFVLPPFQQLQFGLPASTGFSSEVSSVGHDISYDLSDTLTISNRFIFADTIIERFALAGTGPALIEQTEYNEEVNLRFNALDDRLSGLVGASYFFVDGQDSVDLTAFLGQSDFTDTRSSLGLFGELTYAVTDRLDVTAGLRYQRDSQHRRGAIGAFALDFDETFDAFLPKFALGYDVTDDVRVGASVTRGFNPGGVTISFATGADDTFDEETVWNYELFVRTRLLDDRLLLNANLFYADYHDFQRTVVTGFAGGTPQLEVDNADRARSYGLELGASYQPVDELNLFGSLGLLDTKITKFSASADPFAVGNQFPRAPHVTLALGANYEIIDNLTLGARAKFTSAYFSDADNTEAFRISPYTVFDFSATYAYDDFEAFVFVDNAFDIVHPISKGIIGGAQATVQTPREFGAGLRVNF